MGAFLLGFLWRIILLCLVLSLYLVYFRILPWVHAHLLAKMDSSKEDYGYVDITCYRVVPIPFLTFKESFCPRAVRKVSLTSRRWNMWSFISYLGRAQLPSCFSSWSICAQGTASGYSYWVLSISCLNGKYLFIVASILSSILEMKNRKLFLKPPPTPLTALGVTCWFSWSQVHK